MPGRRARTGLGAWAPLAALLAVFGLHLALVAYFFGDMLPLPDHAFNRGDFGTHAAQVRRVIEGLETTGHAWVYDVQLLAGMPNGVLFDADIKGWELWTYALVQAGVGEGWAFNAYVLMVHLALPVVLYAAARVAKLGRGPATTAAALAVLLWSFDSFTHWMWFIGTVTYAFVAYLAILILALFWRWLEDRRPGHALACALLLALGHLNHPYLFFILVAPMLALFVRSARDRRLGPGGYASVAAIVALTLLVNGWWLTTAARFFHYILDSAFYERGGVEFIVWDALGLLHDSITQGMIGVRVAVRVVVLVLGVAGIRAWRRAGDSRHLPWLVLSATLAGLTFLGGYTPLVQIQPYRHNLPLAFGLILPAAAWLHDFAATRPWRALAPTQRTFAGLLLALAGAHLVHDLLYFFPASMRARQPLEDGGEVLMNTLGHSYTPSYDYSQQNDWEALIAWIADHDDGQGRWLVQDQVLGEYLTARTEVQVLGGFLVRNLEHTDANWFRHQGQPPYDVEAFRTYAKTYAVHWVVVHAAEPNPWWDADPKLLNRVAHLGGMLVYHVNIGSRLLDGPGLAQAQTNRIEVQGTPPQRDVLLRFHWLETLQCAPECKIERAPVTGDRVGFIRVPAPHPSNFTISNTYTF